MVYFCYVDFLSMFLWPRNLIELLDQFHDPSLTIFYIYWRYFSLLTTLRSLRLVLRCSFGIFPSFLFLSSMFRVLGCFLHFLLYSHETSCLEFTLWVFCYFSHGIYSLYFWEESKNTNLQTWWEFYVFWHPRNLIPLFQVLQGVWHYLDSAVCWVSPSAQHHSTSAVYWVSPSVQHHPGSTCIKFCEVLKIPWVPPLCQVS